MKKLTFVLFLAGVMGLLGSVQAAELYFSPSYGTYPPGVAFGVDVRLDAQGDCVNAVQGNISYPKGVLDALDTSEGSSIFSLWIVKPTIHNDLGVITFAGGIPGGYCGRAAGDPGLSNVITHLVFQFASSSASAVSSSAPTVASLSFLSDSEALLNDGLGTQAKLTLSGAAFTETHQGQFATQNEWLDELAKDTTPPEDFSVSVLTDPSIFDGKYFAVFSTLDKQTGMDHYEVAEVAPGDMKKPDDSLAWNPAVSPYLIKDQSLSGELKVKAVDKAGNARIATYAYPSKAPLPWWMKWLVSVKQAGPMAFPFVAIIAVIFFAALRYIL